MKNYLIAFAAALVTMLIFKVIWYYTRWDIDFFSGWVSCLTFIYVVQYYNDKENI